MGWHLPLHGVATFSKTEMQHSPKMPATFSKKNLQETVSLLKENGIPAYHQNSPGGVAAHSMSGFSLYGVDIFVDEAYAEKAKKFLW